MGKKMFKGRRNDLRKKIELELSNSTPNVENILSFIDEYEKQNLDYIEKLKRIKEVDIKKIIGGLKQTINAHGAITPALMASAAKRIYGSFLVAKKESFFEKIKRIVW
jgi:hypothetical protein